MHNPNKKYLVPIKKKLLYLWVPLILSFSWTLFSLFFDLHKECSCLFSRSGAILAISGAWVAYIEEKWSFVFEKETKSLFMDPDESIKKYIWISFIFIVLGTFIWGYGDLIYLPECLS